MTSIIIKLSLEDLMTGSRNIVINLDGSGNGNNMCPRKPERFFVFMEDTIKRLKLNGSIRTAEAYRCTLNSFRRYRNSTDILISDFDHETAEDYETYLKKENIAMNTISFYMRILRAVYNRAVKRNLTEDKTPFRDVYTSIGKTVKRAVTLDVIRRIRNFQTQDKATEFARDMFMFSFYTRGMALVDMAYLKQSDICNGILAYQRRKTGQQLYVRWERQMQQIVDRHATAGNEYLLPLISKPNGKERNQYRHKQSLINKELKAISVALNLDCRLSMYVARHSWASIARTMDVPVETISRGMGHDSERTTQIYLKTIDTDSIDRANTMIIRALEL